ncbi:MAG: hypothetical protein AAFV88_25145 [Planctomycetota bacterium]
MTASTDFRPIQYRGTAMLATFLFAAFLLLSTQGCSPKESEKTPEEKETFASLADDSATDTEISPSFNDSATDRLSDAMDRAMGSSDRPSNPNRPSGDGIIDLLEAQPETQPETPPESAPQLKSDLTAEQLKTLLEESDKEMQMAFNNQARLENPQETLKDIARAKLDASIRLQGLAGATEDDIAEGLRGQLQALSHLSMMGDVSSMKALESLARDNLQASDPTVAGDSRIVLIGLAMDRYRTGDPSAAAEIVSLIEGMQSNPESDVPAVLVMAEARQFLANYGLNEQSARVREKILSLYKDSSNQMIAKIAADAAGTAKFDRANRLLKEIVEREDVVLERWTEVVTEMLDQSPEINTAQFLCRAALQLEAAGRNAFVDETYRLLDATFQDEISAAASEVRTAQEAMRARKVVIGTKFDHSLLPTVDGRRIDSSQFEGRVVLMPFWAITFPESLQIIQQIQAIENAFPEDIAIVGLNLDAEKAPLEDFLAQNSMGFPSYRSISNVATGANPVAARFGTVSLPFVAILDREGYVAALDFTGQNLEAKVKALIDRDVD